MGDDDLKNATKDLIIRSFDLEASPVFSEEEFVKILAKRVEYLLAHRLEFFFATMYRLDVDELKIHQALNGNETTAATEVAKIIILRLKEKQASREKYRKDGDSLDDSSWAC